MIFNDATRAYLTQIQQILARKGYDGARATLREAERHGLLDPEDAENTAAIRAWFAAQDQQQGERP